jgi:hypothetical protein
VPLKIPPKIATKFAGILPALQNKTEEAALKRSPYRTNIKDKT